MADLLKGKDVIAALNSKLSMQIEELGKKGCKPCLAIVRVGNQAADIAYEKGVGKQCEKIGVSVRSIVFKEDVQQNEVEEKIKELNQDDQVHGVLIFRPMPKHLDEKKICNCLSVEKDIDGATDASLLNIFIDGEDGFPPCTAAACVKVLEHNHIKIAGANIVIIGRSLVVGKPLAMMLLKRNATVTVCHSKTENLPEICSKADILIAAVGKAEWIDRDFVSPGQVVIDVGINMNAQGKLCGDVNYENVFDTVEAITPVPGGVGTVTTGILIAHTVEAAVKNN